MGLTASNQIDAWLRQGGIVLTASERAARAVASQYHLARRSESLNAWPTPPIFHWQAFVREQWESRRHDSRLILNPPQEQALWRDAVASTAPDAAVLPAARRRLADLAASAHSLLASYAPQYLQEKRRTTWQADAGQFSQWLSHFQQACQNTDSLSASLLPQELARTISSDSNPRPPLLLVGFDRFVPAQTLLLDSWGEHHTIAADEPACEQQFYATVDRAMETAACALWAQQNLARNPDARLLIVTSEAATLRGQIQRAFLDFTTIGPDQLEFSLGIPLGTAPIVRAAMYVLCWLTDALSESELDWLVSSGYLGSTAAQNFELASIMRSIRRAGRERSRWTVDAFCRETRRFHALSDLARHLTEARTLIAQNNMPRSPLDWAAHFSNVLHAAQAPTQANLSSAEYQAMDNLQAAVDSCATLAFDGRQMEWRDFLSELHAILEDSLFSQKAQDRPIIVAGPSESAGLQADAIWFLGASEDAWPIHGEMHPFLPHSIQRDAQMPHAAPQLDWQLAQAITQRLIRSAPSICFSYSRQSDAVEARPSRLISAMVGAPQPAPVNLSPAPPSEPLTKAFFDTSTAPLAAVSDFHVDSGALTSQSQCPFKAFASARLSARSWEPAPAGLSPSVRGQLLHAALHSIWAGPPDGIRTSHQLHALGSLPAFVSLHVRQAMRKVPEQVRESVPARYFELEEDRLARLVTEWLEYERTRATFEVAATEVPAEVNIAKLDLKLRLDRIDLLANGSFLVLDYKTGDISPNVWDLPRPEDLQLPLYASFALDPDGDTAGLAFAKIRAGDVCFSGNVADPEETLGPVKNIASLRRNALTPEMLPAWREAIEQFARDFVSGNASVDPIDPATTCKRCGLQNVCRISDVNHLALELAEEEQ